MRNAHGVGDDVVLVLLDGDQHVAVRGSDVHVIAVEEHVASVEEEVFVVDITHWPVMAVEPEGEALRIGERGEVGNLKHFRTPVVMGVLYLEAQPLSRVFFDVQKEIRLRTGDADEVIKSLLKRFALTLHAHIQSSRCYSQKFHSIR